MNNKHLITVAFFIIAITTVNKTNAQSTKSFSFRCDIESIGEPSNFVETNNMIDTRVIKNFKRDYPKVDGETWYEYNEGFAAKFSDDDQSYMVAYNRNGNWQYTIGNYDEKKMPRNIRARVKSVYYNYAIAYVQEISVPRQTIFLVHVQDEYSWKVIRVTDDGMDEWQDFLKEK